MLIKPDHLRPRASRIGILLFALTLVIGGAGIGINAVRLATHDTATVEANDTPIAFRCGENSTITGTDEAFTIRTGDNARGCDVLFATRHDIAPNCYVTAAEIRTGPLGYEITALTLRMRGVIENATYNVRCPDRFGQLYYSPDVGHTDGFSQVPRVAGVVTLGDASKDLDVLTIGNTVSLTLEGSPDTHTFFGVQSANLQIQR